MSEFTQSTMAQPPFDNPIADIILRSADNVDFRLFKAVLLLVSPFFSDMFSLTPPDATSHTCHLSSEAIPVSEKSDTIDPLMRLCYPIDDPVFSDLSLLESVLEATIKYQMAEAEKLCRATIRGFIETHALDVYAISCRLRLEDEARLAAEAWKRQSTDYSLDSDVFVRTLEGASFVDRIKSVTAGDYHRLLYYARSTTAFPEHFRFIEGGDPQPAVPEMLGELQTTEVQPVTTRSHCLHNMMALRAQIGSCSRKMASDFRCTLLCCILRAQANSLSLPMRLSLLLQQRVLMTLFPSFPSTCIVARSQNYCDYVTPSNFLGSWNSPFFVHSALLHHAGTSTRSYQPSGKQCVLLFTTRSTLSLCTSSLPN